MRVFLMGGTGLIGTRLIQRLRERQDQVVLLTRRPDVAQAKWDGACTIVEGDPMAVGTWMQAVDDCEAVINLVGEGIFSRRWNADFMTLLRDSRVKSTENVVKALAANPRTKRGQPKVLASASAIGYYGPHGDEELTEDSPAGSDFLAEICVAWEIAAKAAETLGVRTTRVRIGLVLDKEGGALKQLLPPFRMFVGGPVGLTGSHYCSWIHYEDLVGLFLLALDNPQCQGVLNGTAPHPVTSKQFAKALGHALHRPSFLPTPKLALRVLMGKVAGVVTTGQRVLPKKALALGYRFQFPEIETAMTNIVGGNPA
jgi:uncharacterized protein (TIGR01777 family)